jgi:hypothetical protein
MWAIAKRSAPTYPSATHPQLGIDALLSVARARIKWFLGKNWQRDGRSRLFLLLGSGRPLGK